MQRVGMLLGDNAAATSPGFDTLDPSQIVGDTLKITQPEHGFACIRSIFAPGTALPMDALYVLKFKVLTPWKGLPGTSADGDGVITMDFSPGAGVRDVQIDEIIKSGSTAGNWIVFG